MSALPKKPQYGIDAPELIRTVLLIGFGLLLLSAITVRLGWIGLILAVVVAIAGLAPLLLGLSLIAYGLRGKFNIRDRMLQLISWKGTEQVLDVGAGRGLLLIGAAKHLTTGRAVGIDIWRSEDLSGNRLTNAEENIRLEGVADRVEIQTGDVRNLTFPDDSLDVILSLLCLHNIEKESERRSACQEIARVLKVGGKAVIGDYTGTDQYARAFKELGLVIQSHTSHSYESYGLLKILVITK